MATEFTYNGVVFHGCKTVDFTQRMIPDPSGTDVVRHEFTITVQGLVHRWTSAPQWVEGNGGSQVSDGASLMADLFGQLGYYRRRLLYAVDGVTILEVDAAGASGSNFDTDVDNGPKPEVVSIRHVAGDTYRVHFTVKCSVIKCSEGGRLPEVVSNRWSFEDSLDEELKLTRTMDGRIRTTSIRSNPQSFRHLVVPPLPRGFRLMVAKFVQDPNGLEMAYTITHRTEHAAPPAPAVSWDARHEVSTVRGGIAESRFAITLNGQPEVNRRSLIGAAVAAAEARLGAITRSMEELGKRGIVLESISIVDHLSKPSVELAVHLRHAQGESQGTAAGVPRNLGEHLALPSYDHEVWPQPKTFAPDSLTSAFQQRLIDPCVGPFGAASSGDQASPASKNTPTKGRSASETFVIEGNPSVGSFEGKLTSYKTRVSAENRQNLYTLYTIKNRYTTRAYRVALPIAKSVDDAGNDAGDDATMRLIGLSPGICHRIVHIQAERVGTWPRMPAPEDLVGDAIPSYLIDSDAVLHAPELLPDGASQLYRSELKLTYVLERPPRVNESVPVGALPLDTTKPDDHKFKISTGARII